MALRAAAFRQRSRSSASSTKLRTQKNISVIEALWSSQSCCTQRLNLCDYGSTKSELEIFSNEKFVEENPPADYYEKQKWKSKFLKDQDKYEYVREDGFWLAKLKKGSSAYR